MISTIPGENLSTLQRGQSWSQDVGCTTHSFRGEGASVNFITQPTHSEPSLSVQRIPKWTISKDRDEKVEHKQNMQAAQDIQDEHILEHKISTKHTGSKDMTTKDVQSTNAGPKNLVCTGPRDGEKSPGEQVLIVTSTCIQSQASTENRRSAMSHAGLAREQGDTGTHYLIEEDATTLGASGGSKKDDLPSHQMTLNKTKNDANYSSSHTQEPAYHPSTGGLIVPPLSQPLHMNFNPSQVSNHTVTETPEDYKAREHPAPSPLSSAPNLEANLTQPRPALVQSNDSLPTFASQRSPDLLPPTMGKQALFTTRNVNNTSSYEQRYVFVNLKHTQYFYTNS